MHDQVIPSTNLYRGRTPFVACQADPRFSYCAYIPSSHRHGQQNDHALVVLVHGSLRTAERYRNAFIEFAEQHQCVVLAPLFPAGILSPTEMDGFKLRQLHPELRYDRVLLEMVEEVGRTFQITTARFLLHGFSGGAQFVHRFFYLHPERIQALSVAAPGNVTFIDTDSPWWQSAQALSGLKHSIPAIDLMQQVPVQLVVGSEDRVGDLKEDTINIRLQNLAHLLADFKKVDISASLDVVDGANHDGFALIPKAQQFLAQHLV